MIYNPISNTRIGGLVISGTSGSVLFVDSSGNLGQNNSQLFWDNTNNRLGIGTTGPTAKLHISDTSPTVFTKGTSTSGAPNYSVENDTSGHSVVVSSQGTTVAGTQFGINLADSGQIYSNNMPLAIGPFGAYSLTLGTNNAARMTITSTGNVGIGTTNPGRKLVVGDGTAAAQGAFNGSNAGGSAVYLQAVGVDKAAFQFANPDTYLDYSGSLHVRTSAGAGADSVTILTGGNVGIGTTNPNANALLDVSSTTKAFMPPRMTTTQRDAIASPTAGMLIFNNTTGKLNLYTTIWEAVTSA